MITGISNLASAHAAYEGPIGASGRAAGAARRVAEAVAASLANGKLLGDVRES